MNKQNFLDRSRSLLAALTFFSSLALAQHPPECGDDECTFQKDRILREVLLPLVELGNLNDLEAIRKLVITYTDVDETRRGNNELVLRRPRREFSEVTLQEGRVLRVEISTEFICIRRADVEKVFKEPWFVGQTYGQWFAEQRQGKPGQQHNGGMSFREEAQFRFYFRFQPSGCTRTFSIFLE